MKRRASTRSRCVPRTPPRICEPPVPTGGLETLEAIVQAYIREYRPGATDEFSYFRQCKSLPEAIRYAALCQLPDGKRHPHQYRIPGEVLREGEKNLQACADELSSCMDFEGMHAIIERELLGIRGIGVLTVYDVTSRIAAHLGWEPDRVYLHAGVTEGARALGLNTRRPTLDPTELPPPFRRLRPREIEDCLCIFKRELAQAAAEADRTSATRH